MVTWSDVPASPPQLASVVSGSSALLMEAASMLSQLASGLPRRGRVTGASVRSDRGSVGGHMLPNGPASLAIVPERATVFPDAWLVRLNVALPGKRRR